MGQLLQQFQGQLVVSHFEAGHFEVGLVVLVVRHSFITTADCCIRQPRLERIDRADLSSSGV